MAGASAVPPGSDAAAATMASMVSTVCCSAGTTRGAAEWRGEGETGERLAVACRVASACGSGFDMNAGGTGG